MVRYKHIIPLLIILLISGCAVVEKVDSIANPEPYIHQKAQYSMKILSEGKYESILRLRVDNAIRCHFYYSCVTEHAKKKYQRIGVDNDPTPTAVDTAVVDCRGMLVIRTVAVQKSILDDDKNVKMYYKVSMPDMIRRLRE